jgi:lipoprotein NlpD
MQMCQRIVILSLALLGLVACGGNGVYVPVVGAGETGSNAQGYYKVRGGDTLYSIAFRYSLDYAQLASANNIDPPYTIFINQKIRLKGVQPRKSSQRQKSVAKKAKKKPAKQIVKKSQPSKLNWQWPIPGEVILAFSTTGRVNKGVDIRGRLGESVAAAADGVVVYAGGGLRGYGKLVIVKHNDHFLSAYGHNRAILVKEGEKVKGGQVVAEIGSSGLNQEMLHFEIRRDGKPEDPLLYLPDKAGKSD